MISSDAARELILANTNPVAGRELIAAADGMGRTLGNDVFARDPNPRFTNSALDGYAIFCSEDAVSGANLSVTGEVAAGDVPKESSRGEAIRVFTGAPIPETTYSVAYQEETVRDGDRVTLTKASPAGQGIRLQGSDCARGDMLLKCGHEINPGSIAALASQGISTVEVFSKPKVCVIVTGDELSTNPGPYQIYDSNSPMLREQVLSAGCHCDCNSVGDDLDSLRELLIAAAKGYDATVVSGGASVGDYDYLARAVSEIGDIVFHGVAIKPGKPFLFAKIDGKPLFGLPGNPASVFVIFELFVRPALMRICGSSKSAFLTNVQLQTDLKTKGREEWLRCQFAGDGIVAPVAEQGSFGLRSLAEAEALVKVPAHTRHNSGEVRQALLMQRTTKTG